MPNCELSGGNGAPASGVRFVKRGARRVRGKPIVLVDLRERELCEDKFAPDASNLLAALTRGAVGVVGDSFAMHRMVLGPDEGGPGRPPFFWNVEF